MHMEIARNSVFDCHLSPVGRQMAIEKSGDKWQSKTLFPTIFDLRSSIELTFSIAAYPVNNFKLERAVDGAPSQIPTLKFLTPPSTHKSHPGA